MCLLLAVAVVHCNAQPPEHPTGSPEEGKSLQIDQLYQIYQATQNNIIQLNTEISLIYQQLADLRESAKATKIETSTTVSRLASDVRNDIGQLLTEMQSLGNEMRDQLYLMNTLNTTTMDETEQSSDFSKHTCQ